MTVEEMKQQSRNRTHSRQVSTKEQVIADCCQKPVQLVQVFGGGPVEVRSQRTEPKLLEAPQLIIVQSEEPGMAEYKILYPDGALGCPEEEWFRTRRPGNHLGAREG